MNRAHNALDRPPSATVGKVEAASIQCATACAKCLGAEPPEGGAHGWTGRQKFLPQVAPLPRIPLVH